jgi:hypothetical protein
LEVLPRELVVHALQLGVGLGEPLLRLMLSRDVGADSAIAEELAVGAESRLAADPELVP